MLRIHCMQQWFALSDLCMEEAFFDTPVYRQFSQFEGGIASADLTGWQVLHFTFESAQSIGGRTGCMACFWLVGIPTRIQKFLVGANSFYS